MGPTRQISHLSLFPISHLSLARTDANNEDEARAGSTAPSRRRSLATPSCQRPIGRRYRPPPQAASAPSVVPLPSPNTIHRYPRCPERPPPSPSRRLELRPPPPLSHCRRQLPSCRPPSLLSHRSAPNSPPSGTPHLVTERDGGEGREKREDLGKRDIERRGKR